MSFKVHRKENIYLVIMTIVSFLIYAALIGAVILGKIEAGTLIPYICSILTFKYFASLLLIAYLKGNAIKINQKQFPEIFKIVEQYSYKLGFDEIPQIYILQGNGMLNAFATKAAKKSCIVIYSNVLEAAYEEGIDAVSYVIGHELGHLKRNHLEEFKSFLIAPARWIPFLNWAYSRACEYTCDNIGYSLCPTGASKGLLILASGKKLYKRIDLDQLMTHMPEVSGFAVWCVESFSSHPLLMKRLANINKLEQENALENKSIFVSPKVDVGSQEIQQ